MASRSMYRHARGVLRPARHAISKAVGDSQRVGRIAAVEVMRTVRPGDSRWRLPAGRIAQSWFRGLPNFGDLLAPLIVQLTTGLRPIWVPPQQRNKLISTGSIMAYLQSGDLVWGSGIIRDERIEIPSNVTLISVRGPLTHERLDFRHSEAPTEISYGDPALLISELVDVPLRNQDRRHRIGIVPHYTDGATTLHLLSHRREQPGESELLYVDVRSNPLDVVRQIADCDAIVSSSLHGLIVADSFEIPCYWTRIGDGITGGDFKFRDYFLGTGRDVPTPLAFADAVAAATNRCRVMKSPLRDEARGAQARFVRIIEGRDG